MKKILTYIGRYFYESDKALLLFTTCLTALLILLNYQFLIDDRISDLPFHFRFICRYAIYAIAFIIPYAFYCYTRKEPLFLNLAFTGLVFLSPAIFSIKAGWGLRFKLSSQPEWNDYWNQVIYWPLLLLLIIIAMVFAWVAFDRQQPFYGIRSKVIDWQPYWLMLFLMIPFIALASTQPDFLAVYPKINSILKTDSSLPLSGFHKILFELSYGSDFIGIELFFRGFLVLAFMKYAGRDAIIPMAAFYCTIHFGKPLGECISSYFGGLLLGIVVSHTRSIWGGLLVHVGIAWLMEIGGYIGNLLAR